MGKKKDFESKYKKNKRKKDKKQQIESEYEMSLDYLKKHQQHLSEKNNCVKIGNVTTTDEILQQIDFIHNSVKYKTGHFETFFFLFLISHLFLQNYNIYRTNFYNYNFYILFLTMIILCKRFLMKYLQQVKRNNPFYLSGSHICLNLIIITIVTVNAVYLIIQLFMNHPFQQFLFLFYPSLVSLLLFDLNKKKISTSSENYSSLKFQRLIYDSLEYGYYVALLPVRFLQYDYLYYDLFRCFIIGIYVFLNSFVLLSSQLLMTSFNELYLHSQTFGYWKLYHPNSNKFYKNQNINNDKISIIKYNKEKEDYMEIKDNSRSKKNNNDQSNRKSNKSNKSSKSNTIDDITILTNTNNNIHSHNNYHLHSPNHKYHLHSQNQNNNGNDPILKNIPFPDWNVNTVYRKGDIVQYKGKLYQARNSTNSSQPGQFLPTLLFLLFEKPDRIHLALIIFQLVIIASQLALLINTYHWWSVYGFMLLCNYYILYFCIQTRRYNLPLFSQYSESIDFTNFSSKFIDHHKYNHSQMLQNKSIHHLLNHQPEVEELSKNIDSRSSKYNRNNHNRHKDNNKLRKRN
eukprot:TRINITY_DN3138_c0_g1_i1.p1 TRINITY_DN3138_c0_g1~~TRINITY_DN3138_c0_g1_i1.p1  ORF type:complete len:583 (-),score=55.16 TRINITY_DN3138_c0_g1_i1:75-1790(-)